MEEKYILDTAENKEFLDSNAGILLDFGRKFPSEGGGSYYLGADGNPLKDKKRETWITSRMAHVYSIGKLKGDEKSKELAEAAVKGLIGELHDDVNGGWYAGIMPDGSLESGKQCYAHAFVILAATSALLADIPGANDLLEDSIKVYDKYFWNEEEGLSCDTWNTEFTVLDEYRGINANMHTVEAFLAAADTFDIVNGLHSGDKYRERAGRIIDHVLSWAEENAYRIPEHFTSEWKQVLDMNIDKPDDPFKPYGATPGHGIEWARLITQWSLSSDISDKERYIDAACRLYDRAVQDAWCADGKEGLVYTTDWDGKPVNHDRMHWTLAEAVNTSAVLFRVTNKEKYKNDYSMFMKYIDEVVIDHDRGSWYHQLDRDNRLKETVWPGKPDLYHAFQAMLIPYSRTDLSIASSVLVSIHGTT